METLFKHGDWEIRTSVEDDEDSHPEDDGDWATARDIALWLNQGWEYVIVSAEITYRGVTVGQASRGGVQHGEGDGWTADANELTPSKIEGNTVTLGSAMWHMIDEALDEAEEFVSSLSFGGSAPHALYVWHENPNETPK